MRWAKREARVKLMNAQNSFAWMERDYLGSPLVNWVIIPTEVLKKQLSGWICVAQVRAMNVRVP